MRPFPGAEGYGAKATGGRGGRVIKVTNLNNSGPGSLQAACEAAGPRIVVFEVAGTIDGNVDIKNNDVTIAGQTASGDGITIRGQLGIDANNVIIRYIRVRADRDGDAVGGRYHNNIILDHVSASWGRNEVLYVYHCEYVTIQNCIISEAVGDGTSHRFAAISGGNYSSYHHNLIAHNDSRNSRWASGCKYNDYRNNVIYNWGYNSCYGGEAQQPGNAQWDFSTINMIANYYKPEPATQSEVKDRIAEPSSRGSGDEGRWYVADNVVEGYSAVTKDHWRGVDGGDFIRLDAPWDAEPIHQQTLKDAYNTVLDHVGCSLPTRDLVDARIIEEVRNGTATYGNGIISSPNDVGGWPELKSGTAPTDSDHDGMPDEWEEQYGLDPSETSDNAQDKDGDGCTNVEEHLNGTDPTKFVDYTKSENNVNTLK